MKKYALAFLCTLCSIFFSFCYIEMPDTEAIYFGYNNNLFSYSYGESGATWMNLSNTWGAYSFTCPGEGRMGLASLEVYGRSDGGTPGNVRLALYDTSNNLVCEGSSKILVSSTEPAWQRQVSFVNKDGNPAIPVLTGGQNYRIAVSIDSSDTKLYYDDGTFGDQTYKTGEDNTGGFPDSIAEGSSQPYRIYVRGSVNPIDPQPAYFGYDNNLYSYSYGESGATWMNLTNTWGSYNFACPGKGKMKLTSLEVYGRSDGGTPGNARLALYDTSNNLICEGSEEALVSSTVAAWQRQTSFVNKYGKPVTPVLTGGKNYRIAVSIDSSDTKLYYDDGTSEDQTYITGEDNTGGFPDSIAEGTSQHYRIYVRGGVMPNAGR